MEIIPSLSYSFFHYINKMSENFEYSGSVSENTWANLDTEFDHKIYGNDRTKQIRRLKEHISETWKYADQKTKTRLSKWIIADWGGIKGNKYETILKHIERVDSPNLETPLKGIASYSKLLAFKNPKEFAIYDARVAASLNAVQIQLPCEGKIAFPYVPGRNTKIQGTRDNPGFVLKYPKMVLVKHGFEVLKNDDAYSTYLNLLRSVSQISSGLDISDIEMILFSRAEDICRDAIQNT